MKFYRKFLFLIGLFGLYLQFKLYGPNTILYYSVFSNIITTLFNGYISMKVNLTHLDIKIKGGITMLISLTFLIFHIQLSPYVDPNEFYSMRNFIIHYFVPILTSSDTLMFDEKNIYNKFTPIYWTIFPLVYSVIAVINGKYFKFEVPQTSESPYPYFFLNLDKFSLTQVTINIILILIIYILMSYYLYWLMNDKRRN